MKKLLFAGIAVSMLAACSNDEVVPVNNDSNAIKFGVVTENGTRAADIYCSNNPFKDFHVYAAYTNMKYIDNDYILNTGSATSPSWDNQDGLRYWPNTGAVTFYGYKNDNGSIQWNDYAKTPQFVDFKVNSNVANIETGEGEDKTITEGQLDLMYAVKSQEKPSDGKVTLNFRHALSQIVFNAKNTNKNLYVEIDGVSVVNVNSKGTYTFPTADTDETLTHPDAGGTAKENSRGTWNDASGNSTLSDLAQYNVTFNTVELSGVNEDETKPSDLTTYSDESAANFANAMILLPQTTTGFDLSKNISKDNGSYFLVKCKIWNVADGKEVVKEAKDGKDADYVLWGAENGTTKNIMIPVNIEWEEGKKYTYTFIFGQGNGGYDPDPTDPDTPDPVLVPITFNVTIDEFINVTPSIDVPMEKPETSEEENNENNEGGENA